MPVILAAALLWLHVMTDSAQAQGADWALLTPTPTYDQAASGVTSSGSGLDIPDRWSTSEDGILIPHPVTMNGRVLMSQALLHYGEWMGVPDGYGASMALSDYLLLAALGQDAALLESRASTFALRFLSQAERGKYACSPVEELAKTVLPGVVDQYFECFSAHGVALTVRPDDLNFWVGATELEKRANRQAFLDTYRDRLLAAAPAMPIELLEVNYFQPTRYDVTRGGFDIIYSLPGYHRFLRSDVSQIRFSYLYRKDGAPNEEWHDPQPTREFAVGPFLSHVWVTGSAQGQATSNRFDGPMPIQSYLSLTELRPDGSTPSLGAAHWDARLHLRSFVVFEDPLVQEELYRFTCEAGSSCLGG